MSESAAQADKQPSTTTTRPVTDHPEWTQRPHWQVTRERRLNRDTSPSVELGATEKQLHWRNPGRHSQQLDSGQDPIGADAFTVRMDRAPHPLGNLVQSETEGRVPRRSQSLFDDAPASIEIAARALKDPFNDPFGEQPLAVSHVSHNDVFGPANEAVFAEEDVFAEVSISSEEERDLFQKADDGAFQQVHQHVFTERNRVDVPLLSAASEPQYLAQSSDLMDNGEDLQRYRLRPEDRDRTSPMWQLDGDAAQAEKAAKQPSFDDLDLGESHVEPEIDDESSSPDSDLDELLKSRTDPFRDDPNFPPRDQEPERIPNDSLDPRRDRTEPDSAAGQEPNLFPNVDPGERAEQQMLNDLMRDERLPDEGFTDEQLNDERLPDEQKDGAAGPILDRQGVDPDDSTNRDSEEGKVPCTQIYNNRNCCDEDGPCDRAREYVRDFTLDKISLDIAPPFAPGEDDPAKSEEKRLRELAKSGSRVWTDRNGNTLATGQFIDISNGNAIILREDGTRVAIRLRVLSQDALCFVNSWWQLPAECRLSTEGYQLRDWTATTFTWKASALCHKPLYFEDAQLERYGHSAGPIKQPLLSGAHFFANVALLPYNMGLHPANECRYALGYYRPGSCAPWLLPAFPLSVEGAAMQTMAVTGLIGILP